MPSKGSAQKKPRIREEKRFTEVHEPPENVNLSYSTEEWLSVAQDEHGHSTRLDIRVSPHMAREIQLIIQGKRFPYRTVNDFFVHAAYRQLYFLHELEPDMPRHILSAMETNAEMLRDDLMLTQIQSQLETLVARAHDHLQNGDGAAAMRLFLTCKNSIQNLSDSTWKRRYLKEWREKTAAMMAQIKVMLMPSPSLNSLPKVQND